MVNVLLVQIMKWPTLWIALALLAPSDALAQSSSAAANLRGCRAVGGTDRMTAEQALEAAYCGGALFALSQAASYMERPARFCAPQGAHIDQVARVVVSFFESVPERQNENFVGLALEGLRSAWPCGQ